MRSSCCPTDSDQSELVAFARWLREERSFNLQRSLLSQSLCTDALEQLGSDSLRSAPWPRLDIAACVRYASRLLPHLALSHADLRESARRMLEWLRTKRLL